MNIKDILINFKKRLLEQLGELLFFKQEVRTTNPEIQRQAKASLKEDKIKLFRFFIPLKSAFSPFMAYRLAEKYKVSDVIAHLKEIAERRKLGTEIPAVILQKKYDGIRGQIHKSKDRVLILTDDGTNVTARLPNVVKEVLDIEHPEEFILDCEIELWENDKHLPREKIAGYLHSKDKPDDSEIVVNVFDILYCYDKEIQHKELNLNKGDLHNEAQQIRLKYLNLIQFGQSVIDEPDTKIKLNLAPADYVDNIKDLEASLQKFANSAYSEGSMIKLADSIYPLNGVTTEVVKYKKYVDAHVKIWRVNKTKVPTVFNYDFAVGFRKEDLVDPKTIVKIGDKEYSKAGRSYNTDVKCEIGDVITIRFHTINLYRNLETGKIRIHLYEPRFHELRTFQQEPDMISQIIEVGREAGLLEEKTETKDLALAPEIITDGEPDGDILKINYLGNKRRFAKLIVSKFPKNAKKVFDPACGCSAVLMEAAKQGYEVWGNDISIYPYWFSKGIFEGAKLNEEDAEKILSYKKHDGWLTTEWQGQYPEVKDFRRILDGLVLQSKEFQGAKLWSVRAVLCRFLGALFGDVPSWLCVEYARGRTPNLKVTLNNSIKEINSYIEQIGGKGKITSEDALKMRMPDTDIIYFDPPYFPKGRGPIKYFAWYKVINSLLLQKEWKPDAEELSPENLKILLEKLCKHSKYLFLSTERNSRIPWLSELKRHKNKVTVRRLSYEQQSNVTGRSTHQRQNLISGKSAILIKQQDPYLRYPPEDETYRYVVQEHWRGSSMHNDFRYEIIKNELLLGWTIDSLIKGTIKEPITTLSQAKELKFDDYSKINWDTGEFKKRKKKGAEKLVDVELACQRKSPEPFAWLEVEGVAPTGSVGATKKFPGVFRIVDKGTIEVGALKPWLAEYFPKSSRNQGGFRYRIFFRQLRTSAITGKEKFIKSIESQKIYDAIKQAFTSVDLNPEDKDWDLRIMETIKQEIKPLPVSETEFREEAAWFLIKPIDQTPYVLSDRAVEELWVSPQGISALPKSIREEIPKEYRYWLLEDEKNRRAIRDKLVSAIKTGELKIDFGKLTKTLQDARFVLQYHYFTKRGQKPVRAGATYSHYDLRIDTDKPYLMHWVMDHNIIDANQTVGYYKEDKDKKVLEVGGTEDKPEYFPPGSLLNPTKDTASFVVKLDEGKCIVLIDRYDLKKVQFKGKKLRGLWLLEKKNDNWLIERTQAAPEIKGKGYFVSAIQKEAGTELWTSKESISSTILT
ncbi:MAG: DNA adenine methylase [Elusimicrobiota bacterium]